MLGDGSITVTCGHCSTIGKAKRPAPPPMSRTVADRVYLHCSAVGAYLCTLELRKIVAVERHFFTVCGCGDIGEQRASLRQTHVAPYEVTANVWDFEPRAARPSGSTRDDIFSRLTRMAQYHSVMACSARPAVRSPVARSHRRLNVRVEPEKIRRVVGVFQSHQAVVFRRPVCGLDSVHTDVRLIVDVDVPR